ncbi:MAG TPA: class I SAM-dependent methyltransferase [Burkholderiales bacterium]|nr:class I SAM-dependent methyltransferase [Burkholderiales bacterium]
MDGSYIAGVDYTGDFFDHLAPAWLSYIAAINGYASASLATPFTWCELGCGKGVTALLLAATHPEGEFHACDINPAYIEYAQRLRAATGLENVHFHAKTFEEMRQSDLPAFDFVALHGVYSWVPEQARAGIRAFLRDRLKRGGLATVSYNAMPGWAHLQPLRQMMRDYAQTSTSGNTLDRAREAYAFLDFLAKNKAGYFATHPAAVAHLQEIAAHDIRYVAHEYLTPHGDPFYFSDVEKGMRAVGLAYAGNMLAPENYLELMAPQPFHSVLAGAGTRVDMESRRDFIMNTRFRRDLYAAQPVASNPANVPLGRFSGIAFCLTAIPEMLSMKTEGGRVNVDLQSQAEPIRKVHALLAEQPASAEAIRNAAGIPAQDASALIQHLVVAKHVAPCRPNAPTRGWPALNSALVEAGLAERSPQIPLACPVTGVATYSDVVYAATMEAAARDGDAASAALNVLERLRKHAHPVNKTDANGAKQVATDAEVLQYVEAAWRELRDGKTAGARMMRLYGLLA